MLTADLAAASEPVASALAVPVASALAAAALLIAAAEDAASRRIANGLCLAVAGSALALLVQLPLVVALAHVGIALAGLLLGTFAFARGLVGGGDVKLMAATLLWAGPDLLELNLAGAGLVAVAMGVVMLGQAALAGRGRGAAGAGVPDALPASMPFGVAIAAGGLLVLLERAGLLGGVA